MINILKIEEFDENKFNSKYQIFNVLKTDDTNVINGSDPIIYSAAYKRPEDFYVLIPFGRSKTDLLNIFPDQHYKITKIKVNEIDQKILLNLLINKQANTVLKFNNITAELYKIWKDQKQEKSCYAFSVDSYGVLICRVSSFSLLNEKTKKKFTPATQRDIDKGKITYYSYNGDYVCRPAGRAVKEPFINRRLTRKTKNVRDYFRIDLSDSKVFQMFRLLTAINNEGGSFIKLAFENTQYTRLLEAKKLKGTVYDKMVSALGSEVLINVVDHCDKKSEIEELLLNNKINYRFSQSLNEDGFNLQIIKSDKEYKDENEEDRHITSDSFVVQNIVYSNLDKSAVRQCWLEMLIKHEAVERKISAVNLKGRWSFFMFINKKVHHLDIEDGSVLRMTAFDVDPEIDRVMEENKGNDPRIITNDNGKILILDTDVRLIPDYDRLTDNKSDFMVVADGKIKNKLRTKRNKYIGEAIDLNTFTYNGRKYYSVGEIGYGMERVIGNSPATKEIIEEGVTIESLVSMMEPNIYQVNRYAVYPYPFKIMNEIFIMEGGKFDD